MKIRTKAVSLLLTVLLVFGVYAIVPPAAFAEEIIEVTAETDYFTDGNTYRVSQDVTKPDHPRRGQADRKRGEKQRCDRQRRIAKKTARSRLRAARSSPQAANSRQASAAAATARRAAQSRSAAARSPRRDKPVLRVSAAAPIITGRVITAVSATSPLPAVKSPQTKSAAARVSAAAARPSTASKAVPTAATSAPSPSSAVRSPRQAASKASASDPA